MTVQTLTELVLQLARQAGFARAGVASAGPVHRAAYLAEWLARGWAGEMQYLARHRELRENPRNLLVGARSIVVVADVYRQTKDDEVDVRCDAGRVARYAWGRDYHEVLRKKLHAMVAAMREAIDVSFDSRVCVDTAPVVEREWAAAAGVGWIGKNTMVLHQDVGSFFFLGEILTTLELAPTPAAEDRCGSCTRCLHACPTGALLQPYQMDARRCISYLTIEHRGDIDPALQPLMGDWIYGCDICQDVCPYNRKSAPLPEPAYGVDECNPLVPRASLQVLQDWSPEDYRQALSGSAMQRANLSMLKRNAKIVAANQASLGTTEERR